MRTRRTLYPLLVLLTLLSVAAAAYLARQLPDDPEPPTRVAAPEPQAPTARPQMDRGWPAPAPTPPPAPEAPQTRSPPTAPAPPEPPAPASPAPLASADDWLASDAGLTDPLEAGAVAAVLQLADTLDFAAFDREVKALVQRDSTFARYLMADFRDFLRLDSELIETGFVERPYLEANRSGRRTDNWVQAYFAGWPPAATPTPEVLAAIADRAQRGEAAAEAFVGARPGWFTERLNRREMSALLAPENNPYHQLRVLRRLHHGSPAVNRQPPWLDTLRHRLLGSGGALNRWLGNRLTPDSPGAVSPDFELAVQAGYLTAVEEVRLRAGGSGQGRWSPPSDGPLSLSTARRLLVPLASQRPDNPVLASTLCELAFLQADYSQAWNYLRAYTYDSIWAGEVEDLTCLTGPGDSAADRFSDALVRHGVITRSQWENHVAEIEARRERIRGYP